MKRTIDWEAFWRGFWVIARWWPAAVAGGLSVGMAIRWVSP
jgi:hypothetical protein